MNDSIKNADIIYCQQVLNSLNQLEKNNYKRNDLLRAYKCTIIKARNHHAFVIGLIFPLLIIIYFFSAFAPVNGELLTRFVALIFICSVIFLIGYSIYLYLWDKGKLHHSKEKIEQKWLGKLAPQKEEIDQSSEKILENDLIVHPRIDEKYLSTQGLFVILRYLENQQAAFLEEAIYMMELDIKNSKYGKNFEPATETVVKKERESIHKNLKGAKI
ncbi:hypothetical protein ACFO26_08560 [Lactococcus nasutitermitis]|uniref:Uncharacterized protein n=1 Tax=Lactococcus nasutitermitis TaxID=1652957 RepID=A0ABV9JG67_9LACT|nr:hypothetical protein [Lactococcus nasutitermitis]